MSSRFVVEKADCEAWIAVAHSARMNRRVMDAVRDPLFGSNFAKADDLYSFEKVSGRVRAYLEAGLEHLLYWADFFAPLKFHEEQETTVRLRPAYTLARAAIEASAQAVWIMGPLDTREGIRRHLALIHWDLVEHRKSKLDPQEKAAVQLRVDELLHRVFAEFQADDIRPPNYLDVIRGACESTDLDLNPGEVERLWRAASGAAHGKFWPTLDLQQTYVGEEYEPGQFRSLQVPDLSGITAVLEAANTMSQYGVVKFAQWSGADVAEVLRDATAWVGERIPLREGVSREDLMKAHRSSPWPKDNGEVS